MYNLTDGKPGKFEGHIVRVKIRMNRDRAKGPAGEDFVAVTFRYILHIQRTIASYVGLAIGEVVVIEPGSDIDPVRIENLE